MSTDPALLRWRDVSARQERNDLPLVLARHWADLDPRDNREAVQDAWTRAEWPAQALDADTWLDMFQGAAFGIDHLPLTLTVYRGAIEGNEAGFSWTTDPERAHWFAHRFDDIDGALPGRVWSVRVPRDAVLADFREASRSESEIVLDIDALPDCVLRPHEQA